MGLPHELCDSLVLIMPAGYGLATSVISFVSRPYNGVCDAWLGRGEGLLSPV